MLSEALVDLYDNEVVSDFCLQSATAFVAAIRGYSESTIGRALDRRRRAHVGGLFEGAENFDLSVARSRDDLRAADELVQRQYAARGYFADTEHAAASPRSLNRASVILARRGGTAVGTVSVGIDSPTGLHVDEINGEFVDPLRAKGHRLGEVVRLAVSHQHETDSRKTLAALFNAAHGVMVSNRLHDVFIEVNPRHVGFYRRALCFKVAGEEKVCPRVNAPSVLLKMTVDDLTRKIGSLERALAQFPLAQIY